MVAITTWETVSFSLLVATSYIHADVAMMRWLTILWIGMNSVNYILLSPYRFLRFSILFITFATASDMYTGNLLQKWCAWNACKFSQLGLHAPLFPAIIFPWQDIIARSARYLKIKGDVAWLTSFSILILCNEILISLLLHIFYINKKKGPLIAFKKIFTEIFLFLICFARKLLICGNKQDLLQLLA